MSVLDLEAKSLGLALNVTFFHSESTVLFLNNFRRYLVDATFES